MLNPTSILSGMGLLGEVALITDGRFSGGSSGIIVGHITPESAKNGPISLIQENDIIVIDIQKKTINNTSFYTREISELIPKKQINKQQGFLKLYSKNVSQSNNGCILW